MPAVARDKFSVPLAPRASDMTATELPSRRAAGPECLVEDPDLLLRRPSAPAQHGAVDLTSMVITVVTISHDDILLHPIREPRQGRPTQS